MASLAQIEANRRNSLQSTGPKTPDGKSRSSQNAYKHGLTAEKAVSVYDDITSFWELEQSFLAQFQPLGGLELHLVRTIISAAWRLQRLQNMEAGLWDLDSIDTRSDAQHYLAEDCREKLALAFRKNCETKTLPTLSLYEQRLERSFYKSLRELRQLQADRRSTTNSTANSDSPTVGQALSPVDTPLASPTSFKSTSTPESEPGSEDEPAFLCEPKIQRAMGPETLPPQPHNSPIGFVCSNSKITNSPILPINPRPVEAGHARPRTL